MAKTVTVVVPRAEILEAMNAIAAARTAAQEAKERAEDLAAQVEAQNA